MNYKDFLINSLKKYDTGRIIISQHALKQAVFRGITIEEIKENLLDPKRLCFAGKQEAARCGEEKYDCYFGYSKTQCHRYIVVINRICLVCTVIKINRRWQHMVDKNAKV